MKACSLLRVEREAVFTPELDFGSGYWFVSLAVRRCSLGTFLVLEMPRNLQGQEQTRLSALLVFSRVGWNAI